MCTQITIRDCRNRISFGRIVDLESLRPNIKFCTCSPHYTTFRESFHPNTKLCSCFTHFTAPKYQSLFLFYSLYSTQIPSFVLVLLTLQHPNTNLCSCFTHFTAPKYQALFLFYSLYSTQIPSFVLVLLTLQHPNTKLCTCSPHYTTFKKKELELKAFSCHKGSEEL